MIPVLKRFLGEQPEEFIVVGLVMKKHQDVSTSEHGPSKEFKIANANSPIDFIPFFLISEQTVLN